ncbi:MAG: hypothetical protein C0401_11090 [Anaerolinea sp.]|nr:hypothetical protein [Anaerolinea sp.]
MAQIIKSVYRKLQQFNFSLSSRRKLFTRDQISSVVRLNRETLSKVKQWITDDAYENSLFNYGLPRYVRNLVDKEIGDEVCYTDVILYLSRSLKERVNYLELGVSVGKNFFQVMNFLEDSTIIGFDIEEINPTLESLLAGRRRVVEWSTMPNSIKKAKSSLTEYTYKPNHNRVRYLCGDIWDENSWERLYGEKFNLIFSDALHNPDALLFEFEMIKKYELLSENEFVVVWDDLGGEMTMSFMRIWAELKRKYDLNSANRVINQYRGWLGVNEPKHTIGIMRKIRN